MSFLSELKMRILDDARFDRVDRLLRGLDAEVDNNFAAIADYFFGMDAEGEFVSYNPVTVYNPGDAVVFDGKLWLQINSGSPDTSQGITPGTDGTVWFRVRFSKFAHLRNRDTKLDEGGVNEVSAAEIRNGLDGSCARGWMKGFTVTADDTVFVVTGLPLGFTLEAIRLGQIWLDPVLNGGGLDFSFVVVGTTATITLTNPVGVVCRGVIWGFCG
jgi:hypothetical protein